MLYILRDENFRYIGKTSILEPLSETQIENMKKNNPAIHSIRLLTTSEMQQIGAMAESFIYYDDRIELVPKVHFDCPSMCQMSAKLPEYFNKITIEVMAERHGMEQPGDFAFINGLTDIKIQINDSNIIEIPSNKNIPIALETPGVYKIELYDKRITCKDSIVFLNAIPPSTPDIYDEYLDEFGSDFFDDLQY